jgi:hypothetical protein
VGLAGFIRRKGSKSPAFNEVLALWTRFGIEYPLIKAMQARAMRIKALNIFKVIFFDSTSTEVGDLRNSTANQESMLVE